MIDVAREGSESKRGVLRLDLPTACRRNGRQFGTDPAARLLVVLSFLENQSPFNSMNLL